MATSWGLRPADDDHLGVLAACWGAAPDQVRDRARAWVQAIDPGDAAGPRVVQLDGRVLTVLERPGETARAWVPRMVGLRGLVRPGSVGAPAAPPTVRPLGPEDDEAARALHGTVPPPDRAAVSPLPSDALVAVGMVDGADLVGIAALVATPAGPPEISVLVGPGARGRGAASTLEGEVLRRAVGRWEWVQHRTVASDLASRRLAARCGFRLVSVEHLVRPAPSSG